MSDDRASGIFALHPDIAHMIEVARASAVICRQHDNQRAAESLEALCDLVTSEHAARKRAEGWLDGEGLQINMGTAAGIVMREQQDRAILAAGLKALVCHLVATEQYDLSELLDYPLPIWTLEPWRHEVADIAAIRAALELLPTGEP
jgi:acetyl-CoA acetyltransferase